MQNKKLVALIVLSVFAVISILHGIIAKPKYKRSPEALISAASSPAIQVSSNVSMKRHAKRTRFKSWKRNPFAPAGTGSSSSLVLNGIIWNKDRPKAMIGDMIVTKGEMVGENKVVDIKPDKVIMSDGTNNFELKMEK